MRRLALFLYFVLACGLIGLSTVPLARAQSGTDYDPSWYDADQPHVQIDVTVDGVYRVSGDALEENLPSGTALSDIAPATLRLFENGREIPIQVQSGNDGSFDGTDTITFVGHRNRGNDEVWAYNGDASAQSSTYHSLYTDTTTYWLTWGGEEGLRYEKRPATTVSSTTEALRDTVRAERDQHYYFGRPGDNGNPLYTTSEGYFWTRFRHNDTSPITFEHTLPVGRRTESNTSLDLSVRLDAETASCHRVEIEAELLQGDGSSAFESVDTTEWRGYERTTVETSVSQDRVPSDGLTLRLTSYNDGFSDSNCPDPSSTPNYVLLDWIDAAYTRTLEARNNTQRFVAPTATEYTFQLTNHSGGTVDLYNPLDGRRFEVPITNGTATVTDTPSTAPTPYWAIGGGRFRNPADIRPDAPSNWADTSAHGADYLILTTQALLPAAQRLASYRRSHNDYQVEVALVQNVFDEFDYGRPTPVAIRRFVHATQRWNRAPRFLSIFGDAQYPIRDGSVGNPYPPWSVPSFGFAPSDVWYAMQTNGPNDWSETLAVGRVPVRTVAQGDMFLDKLKTYEAAPLERWQKRMLLLAGGTSESEQETLQFYSNRWGELATGTSDSLYVAGMDTLQYYKNASDPLDASFQDSLSADLQQGAGWLNYFGHSAAQTWEIVTDPPSEFDNAGRLPVVVSLACKTGSFAGGRFEKKSEPSLGEELVVGRLNNDGTPEDGSRNGSIAHWGSSALGSLRPSARLNDALVERVFVDTMRVLGRTLQKAKAEIAASYGESDLYVRHLLQYGLIGDPATKISLPEKPDFHLDTSLLSTAPTAPTPSDALTLTARPQNRGLVPPDSVGVTLQWTRPDGSRVERTRRLPRFALQREVPVSFTLDERAIGTNTFRASVDPMDQYSEVQETNNNAERSQVVFGTGLELIAPVGQSIVNTRRPTLRFNVRRQKRQAATVTVQLDSVPSFDSPFRQETTITSRRLREKWPLSLILSDSTTYYWRARLENGESRGWKEEQFTVRTDLPTEGWLQQNRLFQQNTNRKLSWSTDTDWAFDQFGRDVLISSERGSGNYKGVITIDGTSRYERRTLGFGIVVLDDVSGQVKANESFCTYDVVDDILNERRCAEGVEGAAAADLMESFLQAVDPGDHVLIRTRHLARSGSATISDRVKKILRTLETESTVHSAAIDTLTYEDLWILQARKGRSEATVERVADASESDVNEIVRRTVLNFNHAAGQSLPAAIGPVSAWDSLRWAGTTLDDDTVTVEVLSADTSEVLARGTGADGALSLESIDASEHPYLRLRGTLVDSTARTAPSLRYWNVTYTGVPEITIDPAGLASIPDSLGEGESINVSTPVHNVGPVASGPLLVRYKWTTASNVTSVVHTDTLSGLAPSDSVQTTASIPTTDRPGTNQLTVTVDHQGPPERITYNNTATRSLYVRGDDTPPDLRVLADGVELPETSSAVNDLQSPSLPFVSTDPTLEILVADDNPNLLLRDTSHVDVYLKGGLPTEGPQLGSTYRRIPFSSSALSFEGASSDGKNEARVLFSPTLSDRDSTYTLKVEAQDKQGNEIEPHQVSFRIQHEQVIKDLYPYPNPMSEHTTFAFRVVGGNKQMLRDFRLRIYTLTGRLVRELDETDLQRSSGLGVGWNKLRWNGRDEDGDRVATGVYLYRVYVKSADGTFTGETEKIAVIR